MIDEKLKTAEFTSPKAALDVYMANDLYGGIKLSEEALENITNQINIGEIKTYLIPELLQNYLLNKNVHNTEKMQEYVK